MDPRYVLYACKVALRCLCSPGSILDRLIKGEHTMAWSSIPVGVFRVQCEDLQYSAKARLSEAGYTGLACCTDRPTYHGMVPGCPSAVATSEYYSWPYLSRAGIRAGDRHARHAREPAAVDSPT
jgi:hypothetical protein